MSDKKRVREAAVAYTISSDLIVSQPVVLERGGKPAIVLMPYEEYQRLQRVDMDARVRKEKARTDLKAFTDKRRQVTLDLKPEQIETLVTEEVKAVRKLRRARRRRS
jgi:PHD/YefM family antitoxin component YafN of YafNO toxin-antitoxin module